MVVCKIGVKERVILFVRGVHIDFIVWWSKYHECNMFNRREKEIDSIF